MPATQTRGQPQHEKEAMSSKLQVKIGGKMFTATLEDNPATAKFRQMLPLTLDMPDLNANEKHARLPERLPPHPIKPATGADAPVDRGANSAPRAPFERHPPSAAGVSWARLEKTPSRRKE